MAMKFSVAARNAALNAIATEAGAAPVLKIRSGSVPALITDVDAGTVLATMNLPSTAFATASGGTMGLAGTWTDSSADNNGTAGHFRLYKNDGTTQVIQGTVTVTGGGGDLTLDNTSIAGTQAVTITSFTLTAGG